MSLQISILKVLSGHPAGRATSAAMQGDLSILKTSGPEWSNRMKHLAGRAPGLDIFTEGYVCRDANGWQITEAGRRFFRELESPVTAGSVCEVPETIASMLMPPTNVVNLETQRRRRRPLKSDRRVVRSNG